MLCIFLWNKLTWYSFFMWDRRGRFNWFQQFLCDMLFRKDPVTHMHGVTVYIKEGLSLICNPTLENLDDCESGFSYVIWSIKYVFEGLSILMCLKIFRRDLWLKLMPCQSFLLLQSLRKLIVAIDNSAIEHLEKFSLFIGFPVWFEVFFFKQQSFKRIAL